MKTNWFSEARFGMFIHWGLYSLIGRGEWAFNRERWSWKDYRPLAQKFAARQYDPAKWAALARDAGMKYMVLTTKHHEGFCLWDSQTCRFNAVNSGARRDLLAEFVTAVRATGLKVGFYYSLGDWFHPDWQGNKQAFVEYTHALVRELLTGYGRVDILWYDLPQGYTAKEWRSVELNAMARQLHPGIVINNRALTPEDFATPEQPDVGHGCQRRRQSVAQRRAGRRGTDTGRQCEDSAARGAVAGEARREHLWL
jgi:alpha-L-fucosidase